MKNRTGVLLINLGTPDAPTVPAVRRYLREFMSDPRVIERRGLMWWLLLNGVIVPRRARKSARNYALIWNQDTGESPIRTITRAQAEKLGDRFARDPDIVVDWAMRYAAPAIADAIARLTKAGCHRIVFFPLYPQYSAATTASVMDKTFEALAKMRWQPTVTAVAPYWDDPAYITALADSVTDHTTSLGWKPEKIVASFHGLPQSFIDKGDPYQRQCEETVHLLREKMGLDAQDMPLVYQSRGGRAVWIGPSLEETLTAQARAGVKNISVIAPGFAADCIETLEEIQIRAQETFLASGGERFSFIPCLNDTPASIRMLEARIRAHLPANT